MSTFSVLMLTDKMDVHIHCTSVKSVFTSVCIHEQCRIDNKFFSCCKQPQLSGNLSYKLKFSSDKSHRLKAELSYSGEISFRIIV